MSQTPQSQQKRVSLRILILLRYNFFQNKDQMWKVINNSIPNSVEVNIEVDVNKTVTHGNNVFPREFRMKFTKFLSYR